MFFAKFTAILYNSKRPTQSVSGIQLVGPIHWVMQNTIFRKNTETRNIFMPSYEIIAPSCEINMKIILIYLYNIAINLTKNIKKWKQIQCIEIIENTKKTKKCKISIFNIFSIF